MPVSEIEGVLFDATAEVLETMFFTTVIGDAAELSGAPWISARLSFLGDRSGSFGVRMPLESGRKIAASFLGLDEELLSELQIREVVCELSNMLCGSVLSRLEKEARFELSHPELELPDTIGPEGCTAMRVLELEDGVLAVWLNFRRAS